MERVGVNTVGALRCFSTFLRRSVINIRRQRRKARLPDIICCDKALCRSAIPFVLPCYEMGLAVLGHRCVASGVFYLGHNTTVLLPPGLRLTWPGSPAMCLCVCTRGGNTSLIGREAWPARRTLPWHATAIGCVGTRDAARCIIRCGGRWPRREAGLRDTREPGLT